MTDSNATELLPCPFCGGNAEIAEGMYTAWEGGYSIRCRKCALTFGASGRLGEVYEWSSSFKTESEAIAAWNSRAERTCENVADWRDDKGVLHRDARLFKCSSCGFKANDFYGDDEQNFPNYCPNCGKAVKR